jgi:hypothetical protein
VRLHKKKDGRPIRVLISVKWTQWGGKPAMMTTWHDVAELPLAPPDAAAAEIEAEIVGRRLAWAACSRSWTESRLPMPSY